MNRKQRRTALAQQRAGGNQLKAVEKLTSALSGLEGLGELNEVFEKLGPMLAEVQQLGSDLEASKTAFVTAVAEVASLQQEIHLQRNTFLHMLSEMTEASAEELQGRYEDVYNTLRSEGK